MRWIRFAILLLVATILQASFAHTLAIHSSEIYPNLLLILLVYTALYAEAEELIPGCFIIGLAADLIGPTIGPNMLGFGLVGSLLGELRRFIVVGRWLHQSFAIVLGGVLSSVMVNLLLQLKGHPTASVSWWWVPVYSSLLGPLLFLPLHWIIRPHPSRRPLGIS